MLLNAKNSDLFKHRRRRSTLSSSTGEMEQVALFVPEIAMLMFNYLYSCLVDIMT